MQLLHVDPFLKFFKKLFFKIKKLLFLILLVGFGGSGETNKHSDCINKRPAIASSGRLHISE